MPTLRRWFEREYRRLHAEGKSALVTRFETFRDAFFEGRYQSALDALPDLHALADALQEPAWHVVIDYYASSASTYWRGDLAHGLDFATQAVVWAERQASGDVVAWYAREMLFYSWLETDGPGYAGDVMAALAEIPTGSMPDDLAARFALIHARCLALTGASQEVMSLVTGVLPALDWPPPYQHSAQAGALASIGRWEAALAAYRAAIRGFDGPAYTLDRTAAQLGLGETLIALGRLDEAARLLEQTYHAAQRSINRAHVAGAQALIGRVAAARGQHQLALTWFEAALDTFSGLGWLRSEAEIAVQRLTTWTAAGADEGSEAWKLAWEDAWRRSRRLRSTDLEAKIETLLTS